VTGGDAARSLLPAGAINGGMDLLTVVGVRYRQLGAWVVGGIGMMLAVASLEYFFLEISDGNIALVVIEISLLLGIAYSLAYGGYWLANQDFGQRELWRVAGWCLLGLVGTGSIGTWVLVNQVWQGNPLQNPMVFGLVTLSVGAAGGMLVGINEVRARARAGEATRQREHLYVLNELLRHHLLNGIQIVFGHIEQLEDHVDEDGTKHLEAIRRRTHRLANLVEDATDLTSTLSGGAAARPVDLAAVLQEEIATVSRTDDSLTVETDVDDDLTVWADEALGAVFEQVFRNVVQFSAGPKPTVHVGATRRADDVVVRVAGDGPGIPADERERLFERGQNGDTAIGLYLIDALVTRYGGDVRVESDEYGTVVVELPRAR